jgi:hypothetical protein
MLKFATTPEAGPACDTTSEYRRVTSADFRASATITTAMNALELKVPPLALALAFALAMWLAATQGFLNWPLNFPRTGHRRPLAGLGAGLVLVAGRGSAAPGPR